jgi:ubiquinone/menaquinone biosynthesis C-methylase UbiE
MENAPAYLKDKVREYWERHPNAVNIGTGLIQGSKEFFEAIERHRYAAEPCLQEMAQFSQWREKRVLEIGCGIGTDLRQFSRGGARVVGLDLTVEGVRMAQKGFAVFGLRGDFVVADAEALPFVSDSFDLIYSNGVIHHTPDITAAVSEIHRVVKVGGESLIMVYHRNSYFARVTVQAILIPTIRILLWLFPHGVLPAWLRLPMGIKNIYRITFEKGFSRDIVFAASTDLSMPGAGNSNPLSRAYTRRDVARIFSAFTSSKSYVRQLYHLKFLPSALRHWIEHWAGWFLFVRAVK